MQRPARQDPPLSLRATRRTLSWTAPRITRRIGGLEIFGIFCGAFVGVGLVGSAMARVSEGDVLSAWATALFAALFGYIAPISGAQVFFHRRRLADLVQRGITADGEIVEAWLYPGIGDYGGVLYRFVAGSASNVEAFAFDHASAVRRLPPGTAVRVRFDPNDPRNAALIWPVS
jgi:hypothetical protein